MLKLFNTLTRKKEVFKPLGKEVLLYTCGPTVYDYAHIGNLRTFVLQDILKRYLKYKGFKVRHVMNLTDIDDKTIKRSEEQGVSLKEFAKKYTKEFFKDVETLNIKKASIIVPATQEIKEMVKIVKKLMEKGFAYEKYNSVYFAISKFKNYGKLSKINLKGMKIGARVDVDEYAKENPQDFALFKRSTLEELKRGIYYETPWGKSRPGWHIECSAIVLKYLGRTIDIHSGGVDLIFPHHENEIAQSEAYTGNLFVKYWVHMEHLLVEGQKMAKSLGNFFTLRDILKKGYSPRAIRYLFISGHYRSQLNFTFKGLEQTEKTISNLIDFIKKIQETKGDKFNEKIHKKVLKTKKKFEGALDDDLNMPLALSAIFDLIRETNKAIDKRNISKKNLKEIYKLVLDFDKVLGLNLKEIKEEKISEEIKRLLEKREETRKKKDFKNADKIRKQIKEKGYIVEDTPEGPKVKKVKI